MKLYKEGLLFVSCVLLFACTKSAESSVRYPSIKSGTAFISGKVIDNKKENKTELNRLSLRYTNPVTAEMTIVETSVDENGCFSFEPLLECNHIYGVIGSDFFEKNLLLIELAIGKKSEIEIICNEDGSLSVETKRSQNISSYDILKSQDESMQMVYSHLDDSNEREEQPAYKYSPKEYASKFILDSLNRRIEKIEKSSRLSKEVKNYMLINYKLMFLNNNLLEYDDAMLWSYQKTKSIDDPDNFIPQELSISYYSFLKDLNLNDSRYLRHPQYCITLEKILSNHIINIPPIKETSIDIWLKDARNILSDITDLDSGLFYDLLAAHSYAKQFNDDVNPLSERQIDNIKKYFKGKKGEIAKILLRKNEEIIKLAEINNPLVVNETPSVNKENLVDAIISKYQGKTVIVDFWATWCGPCLDAMKQIKTIKGELISKNVVFVYITNFSSPVLLWEQKIKSIGGEHYYLKEDEWEYLMDSFGFEYIPSYVIFDSNGVYHQKINGYPGNAEILAAIEKLYP